MQIAVTKKLAEKMKLKKLPKLEQTDALYTWRANITQEGRQRLLVFMHDASRYVLVVKSPMAKTFQRLSEVFVDSLRQALLMDQMNPNVIDRYIAGIGDIEYVANSGTKETAWLTKACDNAWWSMRRCDDDDAYRSVYTSHMTVGQYNTDERDKPSMAFQEILSGYGLPVRRFRAVDLYVRLDLDGKDAVRRLRVPVDITFFQLHKVLQKAFKWQDYHLYSFGMFKKWSENYYARPEVDLIMYVDESGFNPGEIMMTGLRLSDYIQEYRKILYRYDFGDDWHVYIEVEDIIENCDEEVPVLISGEGDSPPEDVGGSGGFEDFLKIIADPEHEDHEQTMEWARSQWWKPFDFDFVARGVKSSLWW